MSTAAAIVMHVLGNVGKLREMAECAHDRHSSFVAQLIEYHVQFLPRLRVLFAAEANRGLADTLDQIESRLTFLLTQCIAQHASQQADVLAQGIILYRSVFFIGMVSIDTSILGSK